MDLQKVATYGTAVAVVGTGTIIGGNVVLDMGVGGTSITFNNLASGQLLPVRVKEVKNSGTTATGIVALRA